MIEFLLGMYTAGFIYYFRSYLDIMFNEEKGFFGGLIGLLVVIIWPIMFFLESVIDVQDS